LDVNFGSKHIKHVNGMLNFAAHIKHVNWMLNLAANTLNMLMGC
jgi:hypothetical protein